MKRVCDDVEGAMQEIRSALSLATSAGLLRELVRGLRYVLKYSALVCDWDQPSVPSTLHFLFLRCSYFIHFQFLCTFVPTMYPRRC